MKTNQFEMKNMHPLVLLFTVPFMGQLVSDKFLSDPKVQAILKSDKKFDVIIGEAYISDAALAGFGYKYSAPVVAYSSSMALHTATYLVSTLSVLSWF